jgi:mRNA interferase RelE/StbE
VNRVSADRYRVEFSRPADRQFRALPAEVQRRIALKVNALADAPRPRGAEKLEGVEALYRLRVGDYRIVYQIREQVLLILVVRVGHRRDVYRR